MFGLRTHSVKVKNNFKNGNKINIKVAINDGKPEIITSGNSTKAHNVKDESKIVIEIIRQTTGKEKTYRLSFNDAKKTYAYTKLSKDKVQEIKVMYKSKGFSLLSRIRGIFTWGPDNIGVGPDE